MKRIWISALFLSLAAVAGAQEWTDALTLSDNDYQGTARSLGMGNAMTAVGGDLGSLTLNPAGSAVAGYSQFTITPGMGFSTVVSQGSLEDNSGNLIGFQDRVHEQMGRFKVPNIGLMMVYDTHNNSGLKRVSFGVVGNMTRDYTNRIRATGTNWSTSLAASLASQADGYPESVLAGDYNQSGIPSWETLAGYQAGLFRPVAGYDALYAGLTERVQENGDRSVAGTFGQEYLLQRSGFRYDLLMNFGLDFNDKFYLGANVGVVSLIYRSDETRSERNTLGLDFPNGFQSLNARSSFQDTGSGVYMKVGFIARPFAGLRIGAAIQTPTLLEIQEEYAVEASAVSQDYSKTRRIPPYDNDEWFYNLTSPFRANAGIAYTFGQVAMLSADYEYCDYRGMRLSMYDDYDYNFSYANMDIRDLTGPVHALRAGMELKPSPSLAIRVGYNLTTGAQYNKLEYNEDTQQDEVVPLSDGERIDQIRTAVTFGLGYSSPGSFYADFAVRFQYLPNEYITPYYYYFRDQNGSLKKDWGVAVPEICAQSALCNALVTLGWRF